MRKVFLAAAIIIAGFFMQGCATFDDSVLEDAWQVVKPLAVEQGSALANTYIDGMVKEGKLTAEQGEALKQAVAKLAGSI